MCPFAVLTQPRRCNALIEVCMTQEEKEKVYDLVSSLEGHLSLIKSKVQICNGYLKDIESAISDVEETQTKPPDIVIQYERKNLREFLMDHLNNTTRYIRDELLKKYEEDEILDIRVQFFVGKHDIYK